MANGENYTVKEILAQMDVRITNRLDRISDKLDSKADATDLEELAGDLHKLEVEAVRRTGPIMREFHDLSNKVDVNRTKIIELQHESEKREELIERFKKYESDMEVVRESALNPDKVKSILANYLQETETRGWTQRERWLGIVLFLITIGSFILNLVAQKP